MSLLHQYVNDRGLVDYQGINARSRQKLIDWLEKSAQVDPESLDAKQQLALWLNLYNALVIEQILQHYPLESILPKVFGIPNWFAFWRFFARPVYTIGGNRYSLNQIEHGLIRPQFQDPRVHFALVCAALGCPLLRNEAYQGDRLELQLEEDAKRFINNPDKVYHDRRAGVLCCSKIFKWYERDFLAVSDSVPAYIQTYLTDFSAASTLEIKYLDYDWRLNQRTSS